MEACCTIDCMMSLSIAFVTGMEPRTFDIVLIMCEHMSAEAPLSL